MQEPQEKKIKVGDVEISYVEAGCGQNAVLLLPGVMGSWKCDVMPQFYGLLNLLPDHTVIAWNIPGMPDGTRKLHLDFLREDAEIAHQFMLKLGFATYSLLGWCNGGCTGVVMSALFPEAVNKLVIWGVRSYVSEQDVILSESLRDMANWSDMMRGGPVALYGKDLAQRYWSDFCDILAETFKQRNGNFCVDRLSQIQCPTFILHGDEDRIVAPEHVPFLQNNIRDSEVYIFPQGKHNINLRYPEEFNELVAKFLLK